MRTTTVHLVRAAILGAIISLHALPASAADVRSAIEAANNDFSDAVAKGDSTHLSTLYADDGQVLPAGSPPIRGTEAIRKFWQGALASGIAKANLKTLEVFSRGATATEVGQYELYDKTGTEIDHGKYIVIWKHKGAKWQLFRDMFSTDVAPPQK
jgi:uncharacterized protein (TIGR02246 family)